MGHWWTFVQRNDRGRVWSAQSGAHALGAAPVQALLRLAGMPGEVGWVQGQGPALTRHDLPAVLMGRVARGGGRSLAVGPLPRLV